MAKPLRKLPTPKPRERSRHRPGLQVPPGAGVKTIEIGSVGDLVRQFMELREDGFWSFRGQRREEWALGLHPGRRESATDVCLKQFKKRCMEFQRPDYIAEHDEWRWLHAALFPDAEGVAKFINSEWRDIAISFHDELHSLTEE